MRWDFLELDSLGCGLFALRWWNVTELVERHGIIPRVCVEDSPASAVRWRNELDALVFIEALQACYVVDDYAVSPLYSLDGLARHAKDGLDVVLAETEKVPCNLQNCRWCRLHKHS